MDYEKKYPITQQPGEHILVQWERGYKKVEVTHRGRLLKTIETPSLIKKGLQFEDTELGKIKLSFSDKPMSVNVVVDGLHSPANRSHPGKELKKTAIFFWMIGVFAVIGSFMEGMSIGFGNLLGMILTVFNLVIIALYFIAAAFTGKGHPWAYYLGFSTFSFMFLLALIGMFLQSDGLSGGIVFLFRIGFLGALIYNMKHAIEVGKHRRYKPMNDDLLDNSI